MTWCIAFAAFVAGAAPTAAFGHDTVSDDTLRMVHNVLLQGSWYWTPEPIKSVADQHVFVGGRLRAFVDVVGAPPRVHQSNVHSVTSAMYVALSCKCGETIADALTALDAWLRLEPDAAAGRLLADANEAVLKTASVLFHLAEMAPNVWSHEPGMLHAALSLNLHLNHLMHGGPIATITTADGRRRAMFHMVNLIERFTIPNCSSSANRPIPADYSSRNSRHRRRALTRSPKRTARYLFKYLHNLLDNAGLSTVNFRRYNVTVTTSKMEATAAANGVKSEFNVVSHVLRGFHAAFDSEFTVWETTTVDRVFFYQKAAFEFVLLVVHENTLMYLEEFKEKGAGKADKIFLSESYIKQNGLVRSYEQLLVQFIVQDFPPEFADHARLILRILNDVISFKTIRDLDFLIRKEKHDVQILANEYKTQNKKNFDNFYEKHMEFAGSGFTMHEFLRKIATVSYVKFYNNIFKSLRNYFAEPSDKDLNRIDFTTKIGNDPFGMCKSLLSVYAYCFDAQSSISNAAPSTNPKSFKPQFLSVLKYLKALLKNEEQPDDHTINGIITNASQYLSYNLVKYPTDGDVREKLYRILYTVTNFVDKYQALHCDSLEHRDSAYKDFVNNPQKVKALLDLKSNFLDKIKFIFDEVNIHVVLCNRVLFKQFVSDFGSVQEKIKMFWKGDLKTINEIRDDLDQNLFDYSSISRYINVVVEWITAVFSYTLLDITQNLLYGFSLQNMEKYNAIELYKSIIKISKWPLIHHSAARKPIVDEISILNFDEERPIKIIGMFSIMTNNLNEYEDVFRRQTTYQPFSSLDTKKLIKMKENLIQMSKTSLITKNKYGVFFRQPLQYNLTDYFLG